MRPGCRSSHPARPWAVVSAASVLLLQAGCSRSPQIELHNRSAATLRHIVVSGSGFSDELEDLAPGGRLRTTLHPAADSALRFAFDADGRHVETGPVGYVEASGAYRIQLAVTPTFKVQFLDPESGRAQPAKRTP